MPHPRTGSTTLAALAIVLVASAATGHSQTPVQSQAQTAPPLPTIGLPAVSQEEAGRIAAGWLMLAQGKHRDAADFATTLLQQFPRSPAALTFAIEAHIAGRGASFALDTYERWLNNRTAEEPGVLARIGRAVLFEWSRQTGDRTARIEALQALAGEGVAEAMSALVTSANAGGAGETYALVALGNEAAIDKVVARMKTANSNKQAEIAVLSSSKSARVVQPLIDLLSDRDAATAAYAADALGKVGRREALAPLKAFYDRSTGLARIASGGALAQLGDLSALPELREMAAKNEAAFGRTFANYLAGNPDDDWRALVHRIAGNSDWAYRLQAAKLLAPYEEEFSKTLLEALMLDPNPEVRDSAGIALAHDLKQIDYPALRRLLRVPSGRIRVAAAARLMANVH